MSQTPRPSSEPSREFGLVAVGSEGATSELLEVFDRLGLAGDFEPTAWLGEGCSAQVFRAVHRMTSHEVALKVWDRLSPDEHRRFLREVDVMQRVTSDRHDDTTCVAALLWAGQAQGPVHRVAWVAVDLYDGSLRDRLAEQPPPAEEAAQICLDLLTGLSTLHDLGILHRDIKPANVLLRAGRAVVSDFGLAARDPADFSVLDAGTPGFVAPELTGGGPAQATATVPETGPEPAPPTERSDIYAAGRTIEAVVRAVRTARPGALPEFDAVIARATDPDPRERFADAAAMRRALVDARAGVRTRRDRSRAWLRRQELTPGQLRRRLSIPMVAALLAAGGVGVAMTWPLRPTFGPTPSLALGVPDRVEVQTLDCFQGTVVLEQGQALLLGSRNENALAPSWSVTLVEPLPPAGRPGAWQGQLYFGPDSTLRQHYLVRLASIDAEEIPEGVTGGQLAALMDSADTIIERPYTRGLGPGAECDP
ncbi:hypothetical protein BJY21_002354 [Kineosphaera limosa]|uniref:non-specific serine/threonine protein kinase n=1 Tax=Kineosphaera limosa NBRC 100340 TaxID=1184609 RepID=K6WE67_9MICO|nr:serine/threonine-protein kinase [Kineosphaera limosa]NYE01170.1 hypothetical protein [Kineosphaera limosa]GAB97595.1 putative protein kinase [Kineosphaera limosa NBRC 100340]